MSLACAISGALTLSKQLWQPRDVDGDPPRLVRRQHLRLPCLVRVLPRIHVSQRLPVGVRTTYPPGMGSARQGGGKRRGGSAIAYDKSASRARIIAWLSGLDLGAVFVGVVASSLWGLRFFPQSSQDRPCQ
jgi:hypothetical protein